VCPSYNMQVSAEPKHTSREVDLGAEPGGRRVLEDTQSRQLFRNAADVTADLLRQAIIEGRIQPGDRLREERLARDLGISRTPIREALLILQTEGVVEAAPNRGSFVREFTADEISDIYETRAVVEAHVAALAAKNATAASIKELQASCRRFVALLESPDAMALVKENLTFHGTVLDSARSRSLREVITSVTRLPLVYRAYFWYSDRGRRNSLRYHKAIAQAIADRSVARAERLMREHILAARDVLVAHLAEKKDGDRSYDHQSPPRELSDGQSRRGRDLGKGSRRAPPARRRSETRRPP
jgi:DNA-binding GntR family transcriptional regulator